MGLCNKLINLPETVVMSRQAVGRDGLSYLGLNNCPSWDSHDIGPIFINLQSIKFRLEVRNGTDTANC
jgi:hypothetical protein